MNNEWHTQSTLGWQGCDHEQFFQKSTKKEKQEKFTGRDYKRLLEKVEKRKEKLEHVREQDPEKAKKLEEDIQWRKVINRAKGQKVKVSIAGPSWHTQFSV